MPCSPGSTSIPLPAAVDMGKSPPPWNAAIDEDPCGAEAQAGDPGEGEDADADDEAAVRLLLAEGRSGYECDRVREPSRRSRSHSSRWWLVGGA